MTKAEFNRLMEEHDFYYALGELANKHNNVWTFDALRELVSEALYDDWSVARQIVTAIEYTDYLYYYYDPLNSIVTPLEDVDTLEELGLFDDDKEEELTLEKVKDFVATNAISIDELYTDEEVEDYVRNYFAMDDMYDSDDILNYVKDNYTMDELLEIDIRWR